MGYLIEQFWLLLVLGFVLGLIIGWLLRHWRCVEAHADLEARIRELELAAAIETAPAVAPVSAPAASTPPTAYEIEEVEGIGAGYGRTLRGLGIASTLDLLEQGRLEKGREELAEKVPDRKVDPRVVSRWVSMCDLMRVPGVRGQFAELLEFSSINSVQELSEQQASSLFERLKQVNAREKRVPHLPDLDDVAAWIESARKLEVVLVPSADLVVAEALAGLTDYPIEEVEGIGKGYGAALRGLGIATTGDLLARGDTKETLAEIAAGVNQQGIDSEVVARWFSMSDLMRIAGVRGQFAELLHFAGVHRARDLAGYGANALLDLLVETEARENRVPELPKIDQVAEWVEEAKRIG